MAREHYGIPSFEAYMPVNKYIKTSNKSAKGGVKQAASPSMVVYFPIE